jgi:hypothetical protein
LQIVAFRNAKQLRQFAPLGGMACRFSSPDCFKVARTGVHHARHVGRESLAVVFHENAYQLIKGVLTARVDPWFEEGFAEYFSSIEVDNKEARVGKIPEYDYQIL